MHTRSLIPFVLAALVSMGGCSSSSGNGGASCQSVCKQMEAAKCPSAPSDCLKWCDDQVNSVPSSCKSQVNALTSCAASAKFTCDQNGEPTACESQLEKLNSCIANAGTGGTGGGSGGTGGGSGGTGGGSGGTGGGSGGTGGGGSVCAPASDDDPCTTCLKSSCCTDLQACANSNECRAATSCVAGCADNPCVTNCQSQHPQGFSLLSQLVTCQDNNCASACN